MDETLWSSLERERHSLAELLGGLTPQQWEHPSLCARWRVKDVAAHVAMTPTATDTGMLVRALLRSRGNLWSAGAALAIAHAERPTELLVEELHRDAASRSMPRLTNADNLLLDILVHGQDICLPLGLERPVPTEAARASFEHVWRMGWPFHARRRMRGVRLVATDARASFGEGPVVAGRLADLLLLMTGRTAAALARLDGEGTAIIAARTDAVSTAPPRPAAGSRDAA
jgi:uncharacterized protein (TIGR03083 family)